MSDYISIQSTHRHQKNNFDISDVSRNYLKVWKVSQLQDMAEFSRHGSSSHILARNWIGHNAQYHNLRLERTRTKFIVYRKKDENK